MNENEEVNIIEVNPEVVYQQDLAMIDSQVATAKKYPRNIKRCTDNALAIVTIDKQTAETCTYAVPRGGKSITGPSVHLAKILAQVWGNLRVEAKVVAVDEKQITSQAVAFDLETNVAIKVEVKRSIVGRNGRFSDDMIAVTGNAANSIAMRNAILNVIPRAVVDKTYKSALAMITGDISDEAKLVAKRKQVVQALMDTYEVSEKEVLNAIGKVSISHVGSEEIVVLIGIGQAIKDGDTTVDEAFRNPKKRPVPPTAKEKEEERVKLLINDAKDLKALKPLEKLAKGNDTLMSLFVEKEASFLDEA